MSLFEIHLIVEPTISVKALTALLPLLPEKATRPRVQVARTRYGQHPVQPMLTYWVPDLAALFKSTRPAS
jgi:hypothetical protein